MTTMRTKLGSTGLEVSALTLGCMSWGDASRGGHQWVLDEDAARGIIKDALEAGINFFDTANVYSAGSSEEITGRALERLRATARTSCSPPRCTAGCGPGPNGAGLSRKAILHEIDASLTPARHRLRRPLPDPPLGPRRRRSRRPWRRCTTWCRPARRATSAPPRCTPGSSPRPSTSPTLDGWTPVRLDAEPLQPDLPRGGAGDAAALPGPGRRRDPVEPAGPRPADPRLGHRPPRARRPTSSAARSTATRTRRSSTRWPRSPSGAASPGAQVALAWLMPSRPSPRRSSA